MKALFLSYMYMFKGTDGIVLVGMWLLGLISNMLFRLGLIPTSALSPQLYEILPGIFGHTLFFFTAVMIPVGFMATVGDSINSRWDKFHKTMPIRKWLIVAFNYLLCIGASAAMFGIWLLLPFHHGDLVMSTVQGLLSVQLFCIIHLTITYFLLALGIKRQFGSQLIFTLTNFAIAFLCMLIITRQTTQYNEIRVAVITSVVLYIISFVLSVFFDKLSRRGFRRKVQ